MKYFISDYSQGAHPDVMEALVRTNMEHSDGYGDDVHTDNAKAIIKEMIDRDDAEIHLLGGGTPANIITVSAGLKPWEAAVALVPGHLYFHETGALEANGHRVITVPGEDGKVRPEDIDYAWEQYEDEHTVIPKLVYISDSTESGGVYTKAELTALREKCNEKDMYLYLDGARLGSALTAEENDLTIKEIANLVDAFYIGGTKNGALFGEAVILLNDVFKDHYKWMIKQNCGLIAKGRLLGVQFETLLKGGEKSIYFDMARHANKMAKMLRDELSEAGVEFFGTSVTNQVFPILPLEAVEELEKDWLFYRWQQPKNGRLPIRLVTGWGTEEDDVRQIIDDIKKLIG